MKNDKIKLFSLIIVGILLIFGIYVCSYGNPFSRRIYSKTGYGIESSVINEDNILKYIEII